jgi:hypothetical protein
MSVLRQVHKRLIDLETRLSDRPDEASEVRAIRHMLDGDEGGWIGTVDAQHLLGMQSVNTVKAWAKRGLLRSKRLSNGRLKVSLTDVLDERHRIDALSAMGSIDTPLTDEELELARNPSTPEVEAIVGKIVALAEARLQEQKQAGDE